MNIQSITVNKTEIRIDICCATKGQSFRVLSRVPVVCGVPNAAFTPGRVVAQYDVVYGDSYLGIPRFSGQYDYIICSFEVYLSEVRVEGICYVTEIDPAMPQCSAPYPHKSIKALDCSLEDVDILGISQAAMSINQATAMTLSPNNAIEFLYNGKPYYFKKSIIEDMDKHLRALSEHGVMCVMRYINAPFLGLIKETEDELVDIILHPSHDNDFPSAYMSAFNVRTEEGLDYFCACTEFFAERYSREDQKYGCCLSFEMGNEVTSQYIWNNAGELTCQQFMVEYTTVMRLAWLLSSKHYANFRIHTSFDQYFTGRHVPAEPKRFYGMRESIDCIAANCATEGDFPWNIAFHPYPENLSYPDFYHDREPSYTFETRRITFKNVEVMPAYLAQEHLLYKGQPRRIILPEQGFNSRTGEPYTEYEAAYGYVLAYLKIRKQPTIDMFLHYSYMDNPWEFGLNLGVRRFGGYDETNKQVAGEPKPIYWVLRDMDTPAEAGRIEAAREFIGSMLFDRILNPPQVVASVDHSKDGLTIMRANDRKKEKPVIDKDQHVLTNFDT
jgi:hypothetical protein